MSLLQIILIALAQGVTEWLPISSSGHILLLGGLFDIRGADEVLINAMAHLGTLFAILVYFRSDVWRAAGGAMELIGVRKSRAGVGRSQDAHLALMIIAATPIALVAVAGYSQLPSAWLGALRSVWVVAAATIGFALVLWWADRAGATQRSQADMTVRDAALIGAVQAIAAIIPGTSRSGITMTVARALGFSRVEAARFSMLIGAPLLAAAGAYAVLELVQADAGRFSLSLMDGLVIMGLSFASALVSIWLLLALLQRMSFLPFVIYRLVLGVAILIASPLGLGWIAA